MQSAVRFFSRWSPRFSAMLVASAFLGGCAPSKPIHLGSLNEAGNPSEFLSKLEARVKDGPEDVKTKQAAEGLKITVDASRGSFDVANNSGFYIDQLSFACEIERKQFVYFTWDVGTAPANIWVVDWLAPRASRRVFSSNSEQLSLLHNEPTNYESLGASQLAWLIPNYKMHDCKVLDIADATEDDPRKKEFQASPSPDFIPDESHTAKPWEKYKSHGGQYVPLPDGSYGEFPKGASDEEIRTAVLKTFPTSFDRADSFNIDPPDRSQGWQAFSGCMEARKFANSCAEKSFRPTKKDFAAYGGWETPLRSIAPPIPKGAQLVPDQQSCNVAFEWKN
jgi:hypothetical protein